MQKKKEVFYSMKSYFKRRKFRGICFLALFLSFVLIPTLPVVLKKDVCKDFSSVSGLETRDKNQKCFRIFDESTGKILRVSDKDFLYAVVSCEMPANFENETLKAQTIASYTYFSRLREKAKNSKDNRYDFKANSEKFINYTTENKLKQKWGKDFNKHYSKIKNAVNNVFGKVIKDDESKLILAAYHAMSSGKTEKCCDVFGGDLKYLTDVESPGDRVAKGYQTIKEFRAEDLKSALKDNIKSEFDFANLPNDWIGNTVRTDSGMVKEIEIGHIKVKGVEIRKIFGLRSSNFSIEYNRERNSFIFTVLGYGHGVGMSQCGAQYMAKQGKKYNEILSWYYPGTNIEVLGSK